MADKHLSSQFDSDLKALCSSLLEMGGMVETQILEATRAFSEMNVELCKTVIDREKLINTKEIEIDSACTEIIAKRQPTARDLRLVMAVSKAITNLERAGDEAERSPNGPVVLSVAVPNTKSMWLKSLFLVNSPLNNCVRVWMLSRDLTAMRRLKSSWMIVRSTRNSGPSSESSRPT